jgi:hypothetical protein
MSEFKYIAKVLNKIDTGPGRWDYLNVGIFEVLEGAEKQVGSYIRNYPMLYQTFFHFTQNGKDFALYSPYYTATRLMELPACRDIGGEDHTSYGFCPTEFFVPTYIEREYIDVDNRVRRYRVNNPKPEDTISKLIKWFPLDPQTGERVIIEKPDSPTTQITHYMFGFVAGCQWGDDSSWKIQYLDLSKVADGILNREERFGYIELPSRMTLAEAIEMQDYDPLDNEYYISIAIQKRIDLSKSNNEL